MANIVLIGAGSTSFSIELLKDISMLPSLSGSTLSLVDIDKKRLDAAQYVVSRFCRESGISLKVNAYMDRRLALKGAEYIISAVKVGGYEPMEKERIIAEEAGYYRGIGDKVSDYYGGIGAYHQLAFFEGLAKDIEEFCPDAWLVQTGNPVFEGTNYITRNFHIKAVGVCHGHNAYKEIVEELGLDPDKVNFEIFGFNHCIWMKKFFYEGKNAYPILDDWIRTKSETYWKSERYLDPARVYSKEQMSRGAIEAYRLYGLMPIGDTARSVTPWWTHVDHGAKCKWYGKNGGFDSKPGWDSYLASKAVILDNLDDIVSSGRSVMEAYRPTETTEEHIPLIDSLANGIERNLILNVPNKGSINGIPDETLVEIPVICNAAGIHNLRMGSLPPRLMNNVILPRLISAQNIIQAYENHDRESLVLWLCNDARTRSYEQARDLIDEILAQPWNSAADEHYR